MALKWQPLSSEQEQGTLPEHHIAIAVLQHLHHYWFLDNILFPHHSHLASSLPSSPPYRSIELMPLMKNTSSASCLFRSREMPRPRVDLSPPCSVKKNITSRRNCEGITKNEAMPGEGSSSQRSCTAGALVVRRRISSMLPLSDIVLTPPGALQAWLMKDLQALKGPQFLENFRMANIDSVSVRNKQLRISLVNTQQLPNLPALVREVPSNGATKKLKSGSKRRNKLKCNSQSLYYDELNDPCKLGVIPVMAHKLDGDGIRGGLGAPLTKRYPKAWFMPISSETNMEMKEHLKFWARAVASTVRQEC